MTFGWKTTSDCRKELTKVSSVIIVVARNKAATR